MNKIPKAKIEKILRFVQKPGRYIGEEINSVKKKWEPSCFKTILCYPDLYEVGMSNFSLRILYEVINNEKHLLAERVFLPDIDMQTLMKQEGIELFSLETKHTLKSFDLIGFTIQYELNYLPMLQILKCSNIPLSSSERTKEPFIMAGGAGIANPEPIANFIDFFFIGEADEEIITLINKIKHLKEKNYSREEILKKLNEIKYIYVPSLNNKTVTRHIVPDLNNICHPVKQIVPLISIVQNRAIIEVDRGCVNNCRFCQAGYYYRPKRERNIDSIINIVDKLIKNTGYNTITLLSLSISNYSYLKELLKTLNAIFYGKGISLSLPSIRIDKFTINLLEELNVVRKSGLTFALETADKNIQKMINKNIDFENFIETLITVARKKWKTVKIYLMIGFIKGVEEQNTIKQLMDKIITRLKSEHLHLKINLHINPVAKKPLTPLCMEGQLDYKIIEEKFNQIKQMFLNKYYKRWINLKCQNIQMALLDAVLSRADREMGKVLNDLIQKGYFFDTIEGKFDLNQWLSSFKKLNINYKKYIYDEDYLKEKSPWEKINFGYNNDFFKKEYNKINKKKYTPSCLEKKCYSCGICNIKIKNRKSKISTLKHKLKQNNKKTNSRYKYKLLFIKKELFKFISHRDLWDVFEKVFRMIDLPVVYSEGFNKRMKFSFIFTPPLMVEGENEILEFTTYKPIQEENIRKKINAILNNKYFCIKCIKPLPLIKGSLNSLLKFSKYTILFKSKDLLKKMLKQLNNVPGIEIKKKEKSSLQLVLPKDKSITKLIMQYSNETFPDLWNKIDRIIRNRIY